MRIAKARSSTSLYPYNATAADRTEDLAAAKKRRRNQFVLQGQTSPNVQNLNIPSQYLRGGRHELVRGPIEPLNLLGAGPSGSALSASASSKQNGLLPSPVIRPFKVKRVPPPLFQEDPDALPVGAPMEAKNDPFRGSPIGSMSSRRPRAVSSNASLRSGYPTSPKLPPIKRSYDRF